MVEIYEGNLRYFERFPTKHRRLLESHIQETISIFGHLRHNMLQGFESDCEELFQRLDNILASRGVQR